MTATILSGDYLCVYLYVCLCVCLVVKIYYQSLVMPQATYAFLERYSILNDLIIWVTNKLCFTLYFGYEKQTRLFKNWMFNFVSLLKYKRQMTGNKLCKPAQRSEEGLHIICYPSSDVYTPINWQNWTFNSYNYRGNYNDHFNSLFGRSWSFWMALATVTM